MSQLGGGVNLHISEVLNCASRQNMVGLALFVFVKTCNYAILLLSIGSN